MAFFENARSKEKTLYPLRIQGFTNVPQVPLVDTITQKVKGVSKL